MLHGSISFGTSISSDYTKFQAQPGHTYRAAILHFVNAENKLESSMRVARTHFHQTPEGIQGLGGFLCLSTDDTIANCCKNTGMFGDPIYKIAIPIILYPTSFQGDLIPGAAPDIQILMIYERGWAKLSQIDKTYPLMSNDFNISGKKQGRGVALDFMPAGPAYWQTDEKIFAMMLNKAKMLVEGPGLAAVDKMLGRRVSAVDIENAIRTASGLPPQLPAGVMPPIPPLPMGGGMMMPAMAPPALPNFAAMAAAQAPAPAPQAAPQVAPPVAQHQAAPLPPAAPTGPASMAQLAAIGSLLAPPAAAAE